MFNFNLNIMKNDKRMVAALHMASSKFNLPLLIPLHIWNP